MFFQGVGSRVAFQALLFVGISYFIPKSALRKAGFAERKVVGLSR